MTWIVLVPTFSTQLINNKSNNKTYNNAALFKSTCYRPPREWLPFLKVPFSNMIKGGYNHNFIIFTCCNRW